MKESQHTYAAAVESALSIAIDTGRIPGASYAVERDGNEVARGYLGLADMETAKPVTDRTLFQYASMTKPVTALAVADLVTRGGLSLDDRLTKFFPSLEPSPVTTIRFTRELTDLAEADDRVALQLAEQHLHSPPVPPLEAVTIRHLLTHSSGLGQGPGSSFRVGRAIGQAVSLEDRVCRFLSIPGDYQPGENHVYSPIVAFDILARIVEVVTATPFAEYLDSRIFRPAGMNSTGFSIPDDRLADLATMYTTGPTGLVPASTQRGRSEQPSGAQGLVGTLDDYIRFARILATQGTIDRVRVMSPAAIALLTDSGWNLESTLGEAHWGLGVAIVDQETDYRSRGSWGWSGRFGTHFYIDPARQETFVLMVNQWDIGGASSAVSRAAERALYRT